MEEVRHIDSSSRLEGQTLLPAGTGWWRPETSSPQPSVAKKSGTGPGDGNPGPFAALLVFTFVLVIAPQAFLPWLGPLRPAWLAAVASIALQLLDRLPKGKPLLVRGTETWSAIALVGWATATIPSSTWPGGSFAILTEVYIKAIIIFWLLSLTVNTPERLTRVAWLLCLMAIPLIYAGISNYLKGNYLGGGGSRIAGYEGSLADNPNDLALTLNLIAPLIIALLSIRQKFLARIFLVTMLGLCAVTVVFTSSRAGFLTIATIWLFYFWKLSRRGKARWPVAILIAALLCVRLLPDGYLTRLSTITNIEEDETGSAQGRWESMSAGTGYILEHPVIGAGIGMNHIALNDLVGATWHYVHNVYLEYGMDLGLPGLAFFLMLIAGAFRSTILVCRRSIGVPELDTLFHLSEGIQGSLCAFLVGGFFAPVAYNFYFYYFAGLAVGARQALENESDALASSRSADAATHGDRGLKRASWHRR